MVETMSAGQKWFVAYLFINAARVKFRQYIITKIDTHVYASFSATTVDYITPNAGSSNGGTRITIHGKGTF